jgi:MtN3 and saliva related transmembrane protein
MVKFLQCAFCSISVHSKIRHTDFQHGGAPQIARKQDFMDWQELTGYLAGICTTVAVVPQILKAWKTRHTGDISLIMVGILICGLALWTLYGFLNHAWPIVVTNGLSTLLNIFLFVLVIYEKRNN